MKVGLVLDPVNKINPKKDSSLAIAKSVLEKKWQCFFIAFETMQVQINNNKTDCFAETSEFLNVDLKGYDTTFKLGEKKQTCLSEFDVILMRKDPPFDDAFLYSTYILSLCQSQYKTLVINKPSCLRDFNEKFFITHFAQFAPKTIITQSEFEIRDFVSKNKKAVVKPLNAMGGHSIFILKSDDLNLTTILETMLSHYPFVMVQEFLEEISDGDIRVLVVDGKAYDYGIKRVPKKGDFRGNLAKGANCVIHHLNPIQKQMCNQIAMQLKKLGISLAGLDLIGNKVSEINITSPTCFREYFEIYQTDVALDLVNAIEKKIN